MSFTPEQIEKLKAKLDRKHVRERSQGGRQVSYIESWHAIEVANEIFGFDGWTRETIETKCVSERPCTFGQGRKGWSVSYICKVQVSIMGEPRWLCREGTGAGHGIDVDLGKAHESAVKESESDAMKRALMTFGYPFGLALYDKEQKNVIDYDEVEGYVGDDGEVPAEPAERITTDVILETGRSRALEGMVSLERWWKGLGPGLKTELKPALERELKPMAKEADANILAGG